MAEPVQTGRWRWALIHADRQDLDAAACHVGLVLSVHADGDGTGARPSEEALAAGSRRKVSTVRRALHQLEDLGYLERSRPSRRTAYRYTLTLPSRAPTAPSESGPDGPDWEGAAEEPSGAPSGAEWGPSGHRVGSIRAPDHQPPATDHQPPLSRPSRQPPSWPDGWAADHPKVEAYRSVIERLRRRLGADWDIVASEPRHVQKLRNAAARAAEAGVDPYRLADAVTAKPLDGAHSYASVLARRIDEALPALTRGAA